jgi:O-antigen/teichoic acid export membrane protein
VTVASPRNAAGSATPSAAPPSPDRVAERSTLLSVSAGVVGVASYTCTVAMAHLLGPREFGQYAAGQMLVGTVGIVASALVPLPLANAIRGGGPGSESRKLGMAFAMLVSLAAGAVAAVLVGAITAVFAPLPVAAAVATAAASIFAISPTWGWMQGELRFVRYACSTVAEVVGRLLFSVAAVLLGWGASGALGGFVVGAVLVLVVGLRAFWGDLAWRPEVFAQRQRWTETADIALTQLVVSVLIGADVVLVGLLGSSSATEAGFQALSTLTKAPVYIAAGTVLVTFPLLRSAGVQVDVVLRSALRSFAHLVLLAAAVLATLPVDLALLVLPASYAPATALLPWLAAAGFGYATMTVLATVLLAMRAQRRSQVGLVLAVVLVLSGLVLGWQLRELVGLAVGGALGALAASVALAVLAAPLLPRGTARLALCGLASTGVLVAALQLVRFSPLLWLGAVGLAGAAALHSMRGGTMPFARRTDRATT